MPDSRIEKMKPILMTKTMLYRFRYPVARQETETELESGPMSVPALVFGSNIIKD